MSAMGGTASQGSGRLAQASWAVRGDCAWSPPSAVPSPSIACAFQLPVTPAGLISS